MTAIAYTWPSTWAPSEFDMRVVPNERAFDGFYAGQTQTLDLLGEYWKASVELPPCYADMAAEREAFFALLEGRGNVLQMWHWKRPVPRGTISGTPTVSGAVSQLARTINIQTAAGATLLAGDLIGFNGQVSMVRVAATANGSGLMSNVDIWPRARAVVADGAAITLVKPLVRFMLTDAEGVPIRHMPGGLADRLSFQLREV